MYNKQHRIEVMNFLAKKMDNIIAEFLKNIDTNWQPSDFLPDTSSENFSIELKDLQEQCKELPYDYLAVLVGDVITEEALPTYESFWAVNFAGVSRHRLCRMADDGAGRARAGDRFEAKAFCSGR